jgi:hypothetical protein
MSGASRDCLTLEDVTDRLSRNVGNFGRAWAQFYGTAQTTTFSLSTWYLPQAVLEGCRVSWLEAVADWRAFRIARYQQNKNNAVLGILVLYCGPV